MVCTGVYIGVAHGIGFRAEYGAIAAMVTAGEYTIKKIVAVWKDETGAMFVLSPCRRCRELMRQLQGGALETEVILDTDKVKSSPTSYPIPVTFKNFSSGKLSRDACSSGTFMT